MTRMDGPMEKRFVIVTPGRTGSSLLASILSNSGADVSVNAKDCDDSEGAATDVTSPRAAP